MPRTKMLTLFIAYIEESLSEAVKKWYTTSKRRDAIESLLSGLFSRWIQWELGLDFLHFN